MTMQLAGDVGGAIAMMVVSSSAVAGIMLWIGQALLARHATISSEALAKAQREHESALASMRVGQDKALEEIRAQLGAANAELAAIRDHRGHVSRAYFEREVETYLRTISQLQALHLKLVSLRSDLEPVFAGEASGERILDIERRTPAFIDDTKALLHLEPAFYVLAPQEIGDLVGKCLTIMCQCSAILLNREVDEHRFGLVDAGLTRLTEARNAVAEAIRERLLGLKVL